MDQDYAKPMVSFIVNGYDKGSVCHEDEMFRAYFMRLINVSTLEHPDADPAMIFPDGRFNHIQQVNDRLRFLRFLLKDGQLWLCRPQANQVSFLFIHSFI